MLTFRMLGANPAMRSWIYANCRAASLTSSPSSLSAHKTQDACGPTSPQGPPLQAGLFFKACPLLVRALNQLTITALLAALLGLPGFSELNTILGTTSINALVVRTPTQITQTEFFCRRWSSARPNSRELPRPQDIQKERWNVEGIVGRRQN